MRVTCNIKVAGTVCYAVTIGIYTVITDIGIATEIGITGYIKVGCFFNIAFLIADANGSISCYVKVAVTVGLAISVLINTVKAYAGITTKVGIPGYYEVGLIV